MNGDQARFIRSPPAGALRFRPSPAQVLLTVPADDGVRIAEIGHICPMAIYDQ